jgi:hypothetical protein
MHLISHTQITLAALTCVKLSSLILTAYLLQHLSLILITDYLDLADNIAVSTQNATRKLTAYPADVIQRFINWSWRFIDAYQNGLEGEAAAWVLHKQRSHRSVLESAMKALETWVKGNQNINGACNLYIVQNLPKNLAGT